MRSRKGFTLIELMVTIVFVVVFLALIGGVTLLAMGGCAAKKAIDNGGVKGIVERVWEGTNSNSGVTNAPATVD